MCVCVCVCVCVAVCVGRERERERYVKVVFLRVLHKAVNTRTHCMCIDIPEGNYIYTCHIYTYRHTRVIYIRIDIIYIYV